MKKISRMISYFELYSFYRGVFTPKHTLKAFFNILARRSAVFPLTIDILVTDKCNLACEMCSFRVYSDLSGKEKSSDRQELNTGEIERLLKECSRYSPVIHFGGGEPFCREDMTHIIRKVKENGMKCLVTTNGTLLNEEKIKKITDSGIDGVIFSMYGDRKRHDMITHSEGSYSRAIENLGIVRRLRSKGTRVYASSVFLPENLEYLEAFTETALDSGADGVKIEHLNFITRKELDKIRGHAVRKSFSTLVLEAPFSTEFAEKVARTGKYLKNKFGKSLLVKPSLTDLEIMEWYTSEEKAPDECDFTANSAVINSRGDVVPCQFFPGMSYGNIRDEKFTGIWARSRTPGQRRIPRSVVCNRCCKR